MPTDGSLKSLGLKGLRAVRFDGLEEREGNIAGETPAMGELAGEHLQGFKPQGS